MSFAHSYQKNQCWGLRNTIPSGVGGGTNWSFGLELWDGSWSISPFSRPALIPVYSHPSPYLPAQHLLLEGESQQRLVHQLPHRQRDVKFLVAVLRPKTLEAFSLPFPKGQDLRSTKAFFTLLEKKQQYHVPCLLDVLVSTRQDASLFLATGL